MEAALEAGAEDFKTDAHGYEIITEPGHLEAVHKAIEAKGIKAAAAEVTWLPVHARCRCRRPRPSRRQPG